MAHQDSQNSIKNNFTSKIIESHFRQKTVSRRPIWATNNNDGSHWPLSPAWKTTNEQNNKEEKVNKKGKAVKNIRGDPLIPSPIPEQYSLETMAQKMMAVDSSNQISINKKYSLSESKQIYGSNGKMPVKLKIKIGNERKPEEGNEIKSKTNDDDDKEERKRRKELKRLRKAAKKAMKLEEKMRKEGAVENGNANDDMAEPTTSQGCGENKTNGIADTSERFPLKLSLRRIPKREEESKLPNDGSGFGGLLKLRISKQILSTEYAAAFDERVLETNNNNQNGTEMYEEVRNKEDRCKKHRKKEKKHKMEDKLAERKKMEEEPPKKIPKIKIRFGNGPLVASLGDTSQQSMVPDERKATENAQLLRPNTDTVSIAPTCSTNLNSSSLVDHDAEKQIMSIERRIQFSPCSSDDDSDSELRQRTSQLLSRIDRFL